MQFVVLVAGGLVARLAPERPELARWPLVGVVLGTIAFAGLGLLLAGTLRGEVNLAAANGLYLVLLLLGGMVIPFDELPSGLRAVGPGACRRARWPTCCATPSPAPATGRRGVAGAAAPGRSPTPLAAARHASAGSDRGPNRRRRSAARGVGRLGHPSSGARSKTLAATVRRSVELVGDSASVPAISASGIRGRRL